MMPSATEELSVILSLNIAEDELRRQQRRPAAPPSSAAQRASRTYPPKWARLQMMPNATEGLSVHSAEWERVE